MPHVKNVKSISYHHHPSPHFIHPPPPKALSSLPPSFFPSPPPEVDMTMQKGHANFFEDVAVSRGGVSDSYPAFFLLIATTSNKNFLKVQKL
jgi:hypothetical protein